MRGDLMTGRAGSGQNIDATLTKEETSLVRAALRVMQVNVEKSLANAERYHADKKEAIQMLAAHKAEILALRRKLGGCKVCGLLRMEHTTKEGLDHQFTEQ